MAIGLNPKHIQEIPLGDYTPQQFLAMALEAAKQSGWIINQVKPNGFRAITALSLGSNGEEITLGIADNNVIIKSESLGGQLTDMGKNERNVSGLLETLHRLEAAAGQEEHDAMHAGLTTALATHEQEEGHTGPFEQEGKTGGFFSIFIPKKGYFITPILVHLNILIFIIMALTGVNIVSPDNDSLLLWGANFRPLTLEGEWWRLLTNCFIHIGIIHLLMNMYALVYIGMLLEPFLGRLRFLVAYLLTGIAASAVSLWWHDLTISAGASGAIFGMYGVFLALLTTNLIEATARKAMLSSIGIFVGYNLLFGLKGGIDNAAHIGGLISGIAIGYAVIPSLKKPELRQLRSLTLLIPALLILTGSFLVYKNLPNSAAQYDQAIKEFSSLEKEALELYSFPDNTPDSVYLSSIKNKGIPNWNASLKLMDELGKSDLPKPLKERVTLLHSYCELRLKSYELIYKSLTEQSQQYQAQIKSYTSQIEIVLNQLEGPQEPKNNYK